MSDFHIDVVNVTVSLVFEITHEHGQSVCCMFTKQCKLVPCEGFYVNVPYVAAMAWVQ